MMPVGRIDQIVLRGSWFWFRLVLRDANGTRHTIGGIDPDAGARVVAAVEREANRLASNLAQRLTEFDERLAAFTTGDQYVRHSNGLETHAAVEQVLAESTGAILRSKLPLSATKILARASQLESLVAFETARHSANQMYVQRQIPAVRRAMKKEDMRPPTEEQAEAIASDEDVSLVLAGAGTGKTAVITGKIAHLVRNEWAKPSEIAVLAFNRKAALEIRERLSDDLGKVSVSTFHALGRRIIAESNGTAPSISIFATDERKLSNLFNEIVAELLKEGNQWPPSSQLGASAIEFITYHLSPRYSAFDFRTEGEYLEYAKSTELRTLNGDLVKSYEELVIANFMSLNGVDFKYEQNYEKATGTATRNQYQPDFFIPSVGLYIEHFAIGRDGRAPPGWDRYVEDMEWKRSIHVDNKTALFETYSWQQKEGVLQKNLRDGLSKAGVKLNPIPVEELLLKLRDNNMLSRLNSLLIPFLHHVRSSRLSSHELNGRTKKSSDLLRSVLFLEVFDAVHDRYKKRLKADGTVDFHDLVNQATDHLSKAQWTSSYRYILVDEFQDISAGRMELLKALKRPSLAFFLVGDDWQSIYRFAGSDVSLIRRCDDYLGFFRELALSLTFRFGPGLMGPSTKFIRSNPNQTQRELRPAQGQQDHGITVVGGTEPSQGLQKALKDIESRVKSSVARERLAKLRETYPMAYKPWSAVDDERLQAMHAAGSSINEMTETFERAPSAIHKRLAKFGLKPNNAADSLVPAPESTSDTSSSEAMASTAEADTKAALTTTTVLVLGRYNHSIKSLSSSGPLQVEFSTVHSAKGKEADYVIVLDLRDVRYGFPSQIGDDPLMELVFPDEGRYPFAEERRLFYVALTRARTGAYLVTDAMHPSAFVTELLDLSTTCANCGTELDPDVRHCSSCGTAVSPEMSSAFALRKIGWRVQAKSLRPPCPLCKTGRIIPSYFGAFRGHIPITGWCSNSPYCKYRPPNCPRCSQGYLIVKSDTAHCTNDTCGHRARSCPKCKIGVLLERNGMYGKFWGCSEYSSRKFRARPPCDFTR